MADEKNLPDKPDKKELKKQAREAKKAAKEDKGKNKGEGSEDDDEGGLLPVILVTLFIILVWMAILALLVKLDIGSFGSSVLTPVLKDVPVVNRILPGYPDSLSGNAVSGNEAQYAGYDNLDDAVHRIKELENELADARAAINEDDKTINELRNEVDRLKTFENNQVEFEKIKDEFYNEVVFGDGAPDIEQYQKYYEQIDPTNAQILYKQVVQQVRSNDELAEYAKPYASMKAKDAAEIFNNMTDRLALVAKILEAMGTDARGDVLGAMDPDVAAQVTKIMEPANNYASSGVTTIPTPSPVNTSGETEEEGQEEEVSGNDATVSGN